LFSIPIEKKGIEEIEGRGRRKYSREGWMEGILGFGFISHCFALIQLVIN